MKERISTLFNSDRSKATSYLKKMPGFVFVDLKKAPPTLLYINVCVWFDNVTVNILPVILMLLYTNKIF